MRIARLEVGMWEDYSPAESIAASDDAINERYAKRELRIVTETNREQLPNFVAACGREGWLRLQPFYQRRQRWQDKRKSKLIESFIMNIPVPPCFLYESELARYEVMDGQQRISTIIDFYSNRFRLIGLEQWPELNGRTYATLPSEMRRGLDRRSISYIVLLKESATTPDREMLLRQQVFERLNTGGIELESQEIRHCLYHSRFDDLLIQLSRHPLMRGAWGLPQFSESEVSKPALKLMINPHFSKMRDVEFVLRFFALRHVERYGKSMQRFLDQYMVRARRFEEADLEFLKDLFYESIELAGEVYGEALFRVWVEKIGQWSRSPHVTFADAVLVAFSRFVERRHEVVSKKEEIVERTKELLRTSREGTFTGRGNTKAAVQGRIGAFSQMLEAVLSGN